MQKKRRSLLIKEMKAVNVIRLTNGQENRDIVLNGSKDSGIDYLSKDDKERFGAV
jgi:hypothetical protein